MFIILSATVFVGLCFYLASFKLKFKETLCIFKLLHETNVFLDHRLFAAENALYSTIRDLRVVPLLLISLLNKFLKKNKKGHFLHDSALFLYLPKNWYFVRASTSDLRNRNTVINYLWKLVRLKRNHLFIEYYDTPDNLLLSPEFIYEFLISVCKKIPETDIDKADLNNFITNSCKISSMETLKSHLEYLS